MRLLFAGTPEPAVVALERLLASEHEVVGVLTRPDAPKGRGRTLYPSPVAQLALEKGIEVLRPKTIAPDTEDGAQFRADLKRLAPDCVPVVAYGNLITEDLLAAVPHGWVNLHFSLLPAWRGAAPVQSAIRAGDELSGATTFRIDKGLDTGPIIATCEQQILPEDTADDLLTRLAYQGADLLVDTMNQLATGTAQLTPQMGEATYAPKILPADAHIDFHSAAIEIDRHIRSVTPGPGAWAHLNEQRIKFGPMKVVSDVALAPGQLRAEKHRVLVGAKDESLELSWVQPPGKKRMLAADWARGYGEGLEGILQ